MTAKDFSKHIYDIVYWRHFHAGISESNTIKEIEEFLTGSVQPIDRDRFSKWGKS